MVFLFFPLEPLEKAHMRESPHCLKKNHTSMRRRKRLARSPWPLLAQHPAGNLPWTWGSLVSSAGSGLPKASRLSFRCGLADLISNPRQPLQRGPPFLSLSKGACDTVGPQLCTMVVTLSPPSVMGNESQVILKRDRCNKSPDLLLSSAK